MSAFTTADNKGRLCCDQKKLCTVLLCDKGLKKSVCIFRERARKASRDLKREQNDTSGGGRVSSQSKWRDNVEMYFMGKVNTRVKKYKTANIKAKTAKKTQSLKIHFTNVKVPKEY